MVEIGPGAQNQVKAETVSKKEEGQETPLLQPGDMHGRISELKGKAGELVASLGGQASENRIEKTTENGEPVDNLASG